MTRKCHHRSEGLLNVIDFNFGQGIFWLSEEEEEGERDERMSVKSLNAILRFSKLSKLHRRRWRSFCGRSIRTPVASSSDVISESGRR